MVSPARAARRWARPGAGARDELLCLGAAALLVGKQQCEGRDTKESGFSRDGREELGLRCAVVTKIQRGSEKGVTISKGSQSSCLFLGSGERRWLFAGGACVSAAWVMTQSWPGSG